MARLEPPRNPNVVTRLSNMMGRRMMGGDRVPEPLALMGHNPLLLQGYGAFETAFMRSKHAPAKLKFLAELKAGAIAGCEWCLDYGSFLARDAGVTEEQMRELPRYRESDAFSDDEKLVIEYAEGISRSPVDVPDELVERMRERFSEAAIVEITWAAAIENMRARFNWALGIQSQDYMEGAFCVRPEQPEEAARPATGSR